MKIGQLFIPFLLLGLTQTALAYDPSNSPIATVDAIKGVVVAYNNAGKTVQYLKKGDLIFHRLMISTRDKAAIRLRFKLGGKLILKSNTKITIDKSLITLKKGLLKYHDPNGNYETYKFKFEKFRKVYSGNSFLMGNTKRKPFISPLNQSKIKVTELSKSKELADDLRVPDISSILTAPPGLKVENRSDSNISSSSVSSLESEVDDIFGGPSSTVESSGNEVEDMFSDSDQSSTTEAEVALEFDDDGEEELKDLLDIDWKINFYSSVYLSKPPEESKLDNQFAHGDFRLKFSDKVKISETFNFFHSGWFEISNRKRVRDDAIASITSREEKKPLVMLNEYYWLKSMDNFDITVGKKIVRMGKGMIVSPADRISPTDSIIPQSPERLGVFIGSLDYYWGPSKFTFMWIPYIVTGKSPGAFSRWSTRLDGDDFTVDTLYPSGLGSESTQNLLKFETTFKGIDFFLSMFNGVNTDPIITNNITTNGNTPSFVIQQEFVPVTNISSGFSTTFGGLELHGEVLKQNAAEGKDDSYTQLMGGFRYSLDEWPRKFGLNQIDIIMEYIKETINQPITFPFILFSSINSRIFQDNLIGTFNFQVSDKLSYNFGFNIDNKNSGSAFLLGMGYRFRNSGQLGLKYEAYDGKEDSIFGKWKDNDNLSMEYSKGF